MIKILSLATLLCLTGLSSAYAGQCQDDVAKIDVALAKTDLDADVKTEVTDLREQAVQLCGAGNEKEGLDVTAEAKAKLAIE